MSNGLKRNGMLICLVGPAGSGKSTLARKLVTLSGGGLQRAVSMTSRLPREGEKEGESYYFVTRDEFKNRIAANELFEWEEVHGNLYGQLRATLEGAITRGQDLILDIDIKGALNIKKTFGDNCLVIFLVPPSFAVMKARILGRGTVSDEELKRRFQTAKEEYVKLLSSWKEGSGVDYLIINDVIEETIVALRAVISGEALRLKRFNGEALKSLCTVEE